MLIIVELLTISFFFLLSFHKANKEAITKGEKQTPIHYAAKNDATKSLRLLIKLGCLYEGVKDYRGRTPLYVAAQLGML